MKYLIRRLYLCKLLNIALTPTLKNLDDAIDFIQSFFDKIEVKTDNMFPTETYYFIKDKLYFLYEKQDEAVLFCRGEGFYDVLEYGYNFPKKEVDILIKHVAAQNLNVITYIEVLNSMYLDTTERQFNKK